MDGKEVDKKIQEVIYRNSAIIHPLPGESGAHAYYNRDKNNDTQKFEPPLSPEIVVDKHISQMTEEGIDEVTYDMALDVLMY